MAKKATGKISAVVRYPYDLSDKKTAIAAKLDQRNYVERAKYGLELHGSMKLG